MSLNRTLRLAPWLALGSWLLATHCADPLAGDCRRTLTCNPEQGQYTLDPDCIWHYPDGSVWLGGPTRDSSGDWYWQDGTPVGQTFVCGGDAGIDVGGGGTGGTGGISVGGSSGTAGAGGTGGAGGGEPDAGPPEEMPPNPNCSNNGIGCPDNSLTCDEETGNCVGCLSDQSCTTNAPRCLIAAKTCVACLQDTDCLLAGFARCDLTTNTCALCNDSAQCARFGETPQCNEQGKCVKCLIDDQCTSTPSTPLCRPDTDICVQCLEDSQCAGDRANSHCDVLNNNTCVPCTDGSQCPDEARLCRGGDGRCVECTGNSGANACTDPASANCNADGECVPCTGNGDCTHLGNGIGICDTSLNPNRCVRCATDNDCNSDTASRCVNNQCVECNNNTACAGQPSGNTVCDTSFTPNRCVECTGTDFATCGAFVCNSRDKTCSQSAPGSSGLCGACVSDAQCVTGQLCAPQLFSGLEVGLFCFPQAAGTRQAPSCAGLADFRVANADSLSVDGNTAPICGLSTVSSCPARADLGTTCATANDCGATGLDDGLCADSSGVLRCTIACVTPEDCRDGSTCNTQVAPVRCVF